LNIKNEILIKKCFFNAKNSPFKTSKITIFSRKNMSGIKIAKNIKIERPKSLILKLGTICKPEKINKGLF
jgi:hypothetical protein